MVAADRFSGWVQRLTPDDRAELVRFQRQHFGVGSRQADDRCFDWRFVRHPLLADGGGEIPFWVCRREGRIVGQQAGLPMMLQCGGRSLPGAWAVDLVVDPEWRLRGAAPALGQAVRAGFPLLCGLNISDAAHKTFRRAGWADLGNVARLVRLVAPLTAGQAPFGSQRPTPAVAVASRLAAPMLRAIDAVALPGVRRGARLEPIPAFDERADSVWRHAAPHYRVLARRDHAMLRWRFDQGPDAPAYDRHYLIRDGRVAGYLVTRLRNRSLVAVDYLCAPQDVAALFAHALDQARRRGAALLACLAQPPAIRRRLWPLGFIRVSGPRFMTAVAAEQGDCPAIADPAAWFLTDGDSDLDHG